MKNVKKLFTVMACAFIASTAFAQTSQTYSATNGLFSTDVDNFMDVNEWLTVAPENGFGMFTASGNSYNLGFAKQFEKLYWGSYFTGDFGNYSKKVTDNSTTKTTTETEANTDQTSFRFNNIFGFGETGIELGLYYSDSNSTKTDTKTDEGSEVSSTNNKRWGITAIAGWQHLSIASLDVKPYVFVDFTNNYNGGSQVKNKSEVTNDTRKWELSLETGASTILAQTELRKSTLLTSLGASFINAADDDYVKDSGTSFYLPVIYDCVFNPNEKFSFGVKAGIRNNLGITKNDTAETKVVTYNLTPFVSAGFQYDTLKMFVLNAGLGFTVPSFSINGNETTVGDTTTKTTTYSWDGSDGYVSFSSGFQFNPVKDFCFDCNWAILSDVFGNGNLTSNLSNNADFWTTVNRILVHNVSIQLSYKF